MVGILLQYPYVSRDCQEHSDVAGTFYCNVIKENSLIYRALWGSLKDIQIKNPFKGLMQWVSRMN